MAEKKFYVTTPIFYPNANLHLGHAYVTTLSDTLARYHRLMGEKTYFLTGSDENAQTVVRGAQKAGKDFKEFVDEKVEKNFKPLFKSLNISNDQFIRTSDEQVHWPGAIALWKKLEAAGDIQKKEYEGLYCVGHEAFMTEKELVDGKCPDHGTTPERTKEENYFFRLSKYTDAIRQRIESGELLILPDSRRNEILSLLNQGLQNVSFSRPKSKVPVGIPVPGDDSQVMYVWCDALSNYITALGYGRDDALYKEFWPGVHIVGKDILRFHAAIWPAMLLSAGEPLPKSIVVHSMILSGGRKMSKTLGNIIDPQELLAQYGTDAVRYFLIRHISPFEDGDITPESFKDAYNADLANGLGNLASRIMQLAQTHLQGPVALQWRALPEEFTGAMEHFEVNKAAEYVWQRIAALDQKITETEPFRVVKTDPEKGKAIITELVAELAYIDQMLEPVIPQTSKKIIDAIIANKKPENLFPRKD